MKPGPSSVEGPEAARSGDLSDIAALLQHYRLPADDLRAAHLRSFFVLRESERLLGCAGLEIHGEDGLLRSVAVAGSQQNRGAGASLVKAAEAQAAKLQLKALYLLTTDAAEYFARRGYRRIERAKAPAAIQASREFSTLCPSSAVCMVKMLG